MKFYQDKLVYAEKFESKQYFIKGHFGEIFLVKNV